MVLSYFVLVLVVLTVNIKVVSTAPTVSPTKASTSEYVITGTYPSLLNCDGSARSSLGLPSGFCVSLWSGYPCCYMEQFSIGGKTLIAALYGNDTCSGLPKVSDTRSYSSGVCNTEHGSLPGLVTTNSFRNYSSTVIPSNTGKNY